MNEQFECFQGCGQQTENLQESSQNTWEAANALFIILTKLWGMAPSIRGAHLFTSRDLFYVNQNFPKHAKWLFLFLYDGNLQLVYINAVECWYKK